MKKIVVLLLSAIALMAQGDLHLFSVANKDGAITPKQIEKSFVKNGFTVTLNNDMTGPFKKQFKKSDFKIFNLMTVVEPKLADKLLRVAPKAGVFIPMGVGIYQGNDDDNLHVSILTSEAQAKIIGIDNNDLLKTIEKAAIKSITEAMPNAKQTMSEDSLKENRDLVTLYEYELDDPEEYDDEKEEIKMSLESNFAPKGFVLPATLDYEMGVLDEDAESPFDFYESYSICKLPVIYTVAKTRPEAAAFAPCTTVLYKEKGKETIVMGFPAVYNWLSSAHVTDDAAHKELMKAQHDFEQILKDITE
ncbi:MAG: DUF302 domain-containing protein [Sulfurimonas sp.]